MRCAAARGSASTRISPRRSSSTRGPSLLPSRCPSRSEVPWQTSSTASRSTSSEHAPSSPVWSESPSARLDCRSSGEPPAPALPVTAVTVAPDSAPRAGAPAASAAIASQTACPEIRFHASQIIALSGSGPETGIRPTSPPLPLVGEVGAHHLPGVIIQRKFRVLEGEGSGHAGDPVVDDRSGELRAHPVGVVPALVEGREGAVVAVVAVREAPEPGEGDGIGEVVARAEGSLEAVVAPLG